MRRPENERGDEAAGDRFRDAVAPQELDALGDQDSDEEDHDTDGEREKIRRDEFRGLGCMANFPVPMRRSTLGEPGYRAKYVTVYYMSPSGFGCVAPVPSYPPRSRSGHGGRIMVQKEQAVSTEAVRAELGRILESPHFDASERNRGFLTYVVEEALAGRTDRIKAYTIATEVFGRDAKFDPQLDSIVRIEAGRLRRSLERYYLTDGRTSHLRIDIPRGGYVPVFGMRRTRSARRTPGPALRGCW